MAAKKEGFPPSFGDPGFLTPLDAPRQGKEPGPNTLVINQKAIPDPLNVVDVIPSAPLRKVKGA